MDDEERTALLESVADNGFAIFAIYSILAGGTDY